MSVGLHRPLCPEGRSAAAADGSAPCAESARPFVLAATILASAMAFIDGSVVTIALPVLQTELGASFGAVQWIVNAYALFLGSLLLVGGALGDRVGRRRVFAVGIVTFAAASIACALAPSITVLIAARSVQGLGAALLVPQSLAIIATSFPRAVRGRAIGLWAGASAITTALGPPLGGFLIDGIGWRAVFWLNVPLSVAALWLTLRHVPESKDETAEGRLDWLGGLLAVLGFGALTAALTLLAEPGRSRGPPWGLFALGVIGIAVFGRVEWRATNALVPPALFKSRTFSGANLMTLLLYGSLAAVLFLLPFDLMERRGLSATDVGLTMLPLGLIIGIGSRFAGKWADRSGPRGPLAIGAALVAAAAAGFATAADRFWLGVLAPVVVMSLGMALVVTPLTTAVMNAAPDAQSGAASGVNNAASRLAGLFAVAGIGATASFAFFGSLDAAAAGRAMRFGELPPMSAPDRPALEAAFVHAYGIAMIVAAAWALLAMLIALLLISPREASSQ